MLQSPWAAVVEVEGQEVVQSRAEQVDSEKRQIDRLHGLLIKYCVISLSHVQRQLLF